jgi:hypothetical protein
MARCRRATIALQLLSRRSQQAIRGFAFDQSLGGGPRWVGLHNPLIHPDVPFQDLILEPMAEFGVSLIRVLGGASVFLGARISRFRVTNPAGRIMLPRGWSPEMIVPAYSVSRLRYPKLGGDFWRRQDWAIAGRRG